MGHSAQSRDRGLCASLGVCYVVGMATTTFTHSTSAPAVFGAIREARFHADRAAAALRSGALDRADDLVDEAYCALSGLPDSVLRLAEAMVVDPVSDAAFAAAAAARAARRSGLVDA